jgi:hypothetical protein
LRALAVVVALCSPKPRPNKRLNSLRKNQALYQGTTLDVAKPPEKPGFSP